MFRMCTCSFFTRLAFFYKFTAVSHCVRTIISVYCSDLAFPEWLALCTVLGDRNLASIHQVRQVSTTAMQLCLVFKHPLTNLQKQKPKKKRKKEKLIYSNEPADHHQQVTTAVFQVHQNKVHGEFICSTLEISDRYDCYKQFNGYDYEQ